MGAKSRCPRITRSFSPWKTQGNLGFSGRSQYILGMAKQIDDLQLISVAEAAAALNVSTRTIIRLIAEDSVEAPKVRRRRLISVRSLRQFLQMKG